MDAVTQTTKRLNDKYDGLHQIHSALEQRLQSFEERQETLRREIVDALKQADGYRFSSRELRALERMVTMREKTVNLRKRAEVLGQMSEEMMTTIEKTWVSVEDIEEPEDAAMSSAIAIDTNIRT